MVSAESLSILLKLVNLINININEKIMKKETVTVLS